VVSKAVAANFVAEDWNREKKIEKRWRVASTSTESGIEQSWCLALQPKSKGFVNATMSFDARDKRFSRGWFLDVKVKLTVKNLADLEQSHSREELLRFSEKTPSHSWEEFCPSELILKDKEGTFRDANENPHFIFSVQIVREKGCSVAFRAGFQHDSFKATGFCGLKNQGATCYLNSLLQAL
jgi:ubiquitin carboxyl-terminal hydrolase 7